MTRIAWILVWTLAVSCTSIGATNHGKGKESVDLLPAPSATDDELGGLVASTRRLLLSTCLDKHPNVFVYQALASDDGDISGSCVPRPLYIGTSSCDSPSRQAAYRLPARCGWRAGGPEGSPLTEGLPLQKQPRAATPMKSSVLWLYSVIVDPTGTRYHESAETLVSLDGLQVLSSEHFLVEP